MKVAQPGSLGCSSFHLCSLAQPSPLGLATAACELSRLRTCVFKGLDSALRTLVSECPLFSQTLSFFFREGQGGSA